MDKNYLNYNVEDLVEDKLFVSWVLNGENNNRWNDFLDNNADFREKAGKARRIILLFQEKHELLDEDSLLSLWKKIDDYDKLHRQKIRKLKPGKILGWAATLFLVLSTGLVGYYYLSNQNSTYQFTNSGLPSNEEESLLVLGSGESVSLQNDNSSVSVSNDNKLIINNDSIIDLSEMGMGHDSNIKMNEAIIPYGKKSELLLADGTKVWLNAGSRLAFPSRFVKKYREVYLEGEAYFEVAENKDQPFIVKANEVDVKVLGTHFLVSAYEDQKHIETVLLEGSVVFANQKSLGFGKKEVLLKPGQKGSFSKEQRDFVVTTEQNAEDYIAWTQGWFNFSKQNLMDVFTKLERYYNVEIITPESNFEPEELITGKLDLKDSLEDVLVALSDVAKIDFNITDRKVYIRKR